MYHIEVTGFMLPDAYCVNSSQGCSDKSQLIEVTTFFMDSFSTAQGGDNQLDLQTFSEGCSTIMSDGRGKQIVYYIKCYMN